MSDEEAYKVAPFIRVMSRARPNDKLRLVQMLQRQGEVVAVTGDGTNDAPALHYAHVGLSLGSGTSVHQCNERCERFLGEVQLGICC